jgi:hypothetical protein
VLFYTLIVSRKELFFTSAKLVIRNNLIIEQIAVPVERCILASVLGGDCRFRCGFIPGTMKQRLPVN